MTMSNPVLYARFHTDDRCYVYDASSNQILETPRSVWERIDTLLQGGWNPGSPARPDGPAPTSELLLASQELKQAFEAGYLHPCSIASLQFYPSKQTLQDRITSAMPQLTLEVTERCNSRCRYCAYTYDSRRLSEPEDMSIDTALRAVRIFLAHSGNATSRTISFWGGEPLLRFAMIRDVIRRVADMTDGGTPPSYSFTTNATLITDEIARFLSEHRVKLLVSVDGPADIHDRHRASAQGGGTFEAVMAGLRRLREVDETYYRSAVWFNCVVARRTRLSEVFDFFRTDDLVRGHRVVYSAANAHCTPFHDDYGGLDDDQRDELRHAFIEVAKRGELTGSNDIVAFAVQPLIPIALRTRSPLGSSPWPNGCCVPLLKKMHVRANGDVHLCEQTPYDNCVGNVDQQGLDFDAAIGLAEEYAARSLPDCRACWAVRLCSACYRHFMSGRRWSAPDRAMECERRRGSLLQSLRIYAWIVEQYPRAFDYLKDVKFSFPV